jgi:hypothetical protein
MLEKVCREDLDYLYGVFPEIGEIRDAGLARIVGEIWIEVWRESSWQRIEDCPKNPEKFGDMKLVPHIRSVIAVSVATAKSIAQFYDVPAINMDELLAVTLLHDVDKLLIYEMKDGAYRKSAFSKRLPHGTYTGFKMLERGLSKDLVNAVLAHTGESKSSPVTVEGLIMKWSDQAESEIMKFYSRS